jgi:hypothetical protein
MAKESMKAREVKREKKYAGEKKSFVRSWRFRRFAKPNASLFVCTIVVKL